MKKLLLLLVVGLLLTACGDKKKSDADDKKSDKSEVQIKEETAAAVKTQSAISLSGQDARSKSYEDKRNHYIDFFKSATKDINNAETMQDLLDIFKDLKKGADKLDKEISAKEIEKIEKEPEFQRVQADFIRACSAAGERCAQNAIENGEDPTPYLQELQEYM